jgi:uncharacterized protein YutE (UPF0331/DUF86 family)
MTVEIDPNKAHERIDQFLDEIDELLNKRVDKGKDHKESLSAKLDNFAEVAFSDGKNKRESLQYRSLSTLNPSQRQKQRRYNDSLKHKRDQLEAWKQQIELESDLTTNDSGNDSDYTEIEEEISELDRKLPLYAEDLQQSLDELESGHHLASAMIAGRVIDHTIDQIKSSQSLGGPDEVLDQLEENGVVDSNEGQIMNAVKSYRNRYAHEVGKSPDVKETFIILLGCAKLLHNIQSAGKTREFDLA